MRRAKIICYAVAIMILLAFGCSKQVMQVMSVENPIVEVGKTTIANLANPGDLTYYIDDGNSIIYVSADRRESLKEELGATGDETYWTVVKKDRKRDFEVRDIVTLDYGQFAKEDDEAEKENWTCVFYNGCVNVNPFGPGLPTNIKSIKYEGLLCKLTGNDEDVCKFEIKLIQVETFLEKDCPGSGTKQKKKLATCIK